MRILTLSNLYPPRFIGGYELGCRDVMQGLVQRGHQVMVLTSTWEVEEGIVEDDGPIRVQRLIRHFIGQPEEPTGTSLWFMNLHNQAVLQRAIKDFMPDLIYIWNLAGLPFRLALNAQQSALPLCCYVSDLWLSRWQNEESEKTPKKNEIVRKLGGFSRVFGPLRPPASALNFCRVQCTSNFIKEASIPHDLSEQNTIYEVIHWGIEIEKFQKVAACHVKQNDVGAARRLIYAGQLAPHKGVVTLIEAVQILKKEGVRVALTIAGPSTYGNHGDELRALAQSFNLQNEIEFLGPVPREQLPQLLAAQEIFVFPAVWDEPFSIGLLEAMAAGLGVVSTTTGGSREIVRHEENALSFLAGDAKDCARQIKRLLDDALLLEKVSSQARRTVCENFTMQQMLGRIEASLEASLQVVL